MPKRKEKRDVFCSSLGESPLLRVATFTRARDYFPLSSIPEENAGPLIV